MKNKNFKIVGLILMLVGAVSCEDVFEADITQERVELLSPVDSLLTEQSVHTFWWTELEGATQYSLQIVRGTFEFSESLVLDTTITQDSYDYSLSPGDYQWRVQGENSAYSSQYSIHSLFIDSTINLIGSQIELSSPEENYASSELSVDFTWEAMYNADGYLWELRDENGDLVNQQSELTNLTASYGFSQDGVYTWQVKAFNNTSNTYTSFSSRSIHIDTQSPELAVLISPANGDSLIGLAQVQFQWESTQGLENESEVTDYLYISTDDSFIETPVTIEEGVQTYSQVLEQGSYYWKLERVDAAGNTTGAIQINQFVVEGE